MFELIPEVCGELRKEMVNIYWLLVIPIILLTIIFEFFKQELNFEGIAKRMVISFILLISFDSIIYVIDLMKNGIIEKIDGIASLAGTLEILEKRFSAETPNLFKFREMIIYTIGMGCYSLALLSFYLTDALSQFVYSILYVISPLAFLCLIPNRTSHITGNVFKGIVTVSIWQILWSILGVMLLSFTKNPVWDWENFFMTSLINLCIGFSMLMIPLFTKSLIGDGLESLSTSLVSSVTVPVSKFIARYPLQKAQGAAASTVGMSLNKFHGNRRRTEHNSPYLRAKKAADQQKLAQMKKDGPPKHKELRGAYDKAILQLERRIKHPGRYK